MTEPPKSNFVANWHERSLFVDVGQLPTTQRQLNLYYYFIFIREIFKSRQIREALELGAGRGTISLYLAKYLGLKVTLLDSEPVAMVIAREGFAAQNQKAEFIVGDALATGLPDGSFDAIVSIGLAEHFSPAEVAKLLAEQYRLLRPGGVMISLNIPKKFSIQSLNTLWQFVRHFKKRPDYFRNRLKASNYARLARQAGFSAVATTHVCPFPIWVPVSVVTDRRLTTFRRFILKLRAYFQPYPFKTNSLIAQAHFLVAHK